MTLKWEGQCKNQDTWRTKKKACSYEVNRLETQETTTLAFNATLLL